MNYWLLKSEPETFSWDTLEKEGQSIWDGVRNYQARNNLRLMKKQDIFFFYHSGKEPGIIGLAEVIKEHFPDTTATKGDWSVVEVKPIRKLKRFIALQEIKQIPELQNMVLVKNTRLSVQPVTEVEYKLILRLESQANSNLSKTNAH
jgi:predicted RNA-binding protein with PUA-like domain